MTPVQQTKLAGHDLHLGNCFAACVASVINWPLWAVPSFEDAKRRSMFELAGEWCRLLGWRFEFADGHAWQQGEHYIASGLSPRGVYHAVVYLNGQLVHDPHPLGGGITTVERTYRIIKTPAAPLDPS